MSCSSVQQDRGSCHCKLLTRQVTSYLLKSQTESQMSDSVYIYIICRPEDFNSSMWQNGERSNKDLVREIEESWRTLRFGQSWYFYWMAQTSSSNSRRGHSPKSFKTSEISCLPRWSLYFMSNFSIQLRCDQISSLLTSLIQHIYAFPLMLCDSLVLLHISSNVGLSNIFTSMNFVMFFNITVMSFFFLLLVTLYKFL